MVQNQFYSLYYRPTTIMHSEKFWSNLYCWNLQLTYCVKPDTAIYRSVSLAHWCYLSKSLTKNGAYILTPHQIERRLTVFTALKIIYKDQYDVANQQLAVTITKLLQTGKRFSNTHGIRTKHSFLPYSPCVHNCMWFPAAIREAILTYGAGWLQVVLSLVELSLIIITTFFSRSCQERREYLIFWWLSPNRSVVTHFLRREYIFNRSNIKIDIAWNQKILKRICSAR